MGEEDEAALVGIDEGVALANTVTNQKAPRSLRGPRYWQALKIR